MSSGSDLLLFSNKINHTRLNRQKEEVKTKSTVNHQRHTMKRSDKVLHRPEVIHTVYNPLTRDYFFVFIVYHKARSAPWLKMIQQTIRKRLSTRAKASSMGMTDFPLTHEYLAERHQVPCNHVLKGGCATSTFASRRYRGWSTIWLDVLID